MEKNFRRRSVTLAATCIVVGLCLLALVQSLHIMKLGDNLQSVSQRLELMTSAADAQASLSSETK
ncbi:MAG: hypothetical protein V1738_01365 [Patescibacteria group bacterium]